MRRLEQAQIDRMRVDVAKVCGDRAGRARIYGVLRQVHDWGLLHEIAPYIRVEKGAMQRGWVAGEHVLEPCKAAIHTGLQLFKALEFLVRRIVDAWPQFEDLAPEPTAYERIVHGDLQKWLDALAASQLPMNGFVLETIAGFAGCSVEGLRRFGASTGVEAALRVGWSIRHAIAGDMPHPFLWLGLIEGERHKALPVTGRLRPVCPAGTAWDDRAILVAVAAGAMTPKKIFEKVLQAGVTLKPLRIRQRKKDLVSWTFLRAKAREWRLTDLGEAWVRDMQAANQGTAT